MRAVKSVSIDSDRRVIITYLDGSTETLYPNCIWCDSEALRQLIKDLLEEKADAITQTIENVTIATFSDGADEGLIKKLLVSIEPIQEGSGNPSPDNVRPISGKQGVKVYLAGKDILSDITMENGYYAADGTPSPSSSTKRSATFIPVKKGDIFALRFVTISENSRLSVHEYDENQNWLRQVYSSDVLSSGAYTFDIPVSPDAKYVRFSLPNYSTLNVFTNSSNISVDFGQTIYGGNLDVLSGKLTMDRVVVIFEGSEAWNAATTDPSTNAYRFRTTLPDMLFGTGVNGTQLCDKLMPTTGNTGSGSSSIITGNEKSITLLSNQAVVYINASGLINEDSIIAFKEWLSINKPTLCYRLAKPVEYQLTPQEVSSLLGDNNIWCDSGDILELEYTADTKLYIGESQVGRTSSAQQSINKPVEFEPSIVKPVTEVTEKEQIEEEE